MRSPGPSVRETVSDRNQHRHQRLQDEAKAYRSVRSLHDIVPDAFEGSDSNAVPYDAGDREHQD